MICATVLEQAPRNAVASHVGRRLCDPNLQRFAGHLDGVPGTLDRAGLAFPCQVGEQSPRHGQVRPGSSPGGRQARDLDERRDVVDHGRHIERPLPQQVHQNQPGSRQA